MATPRTTNPRNGVDKTLEDHIRDKTYDPRRHGEIPADLAEAIFGPKKLPPSKMPKGLGKEGIWLWKFLIENASGVMPGDALTMESFCRVWAEYKRIQPILAGLSPKAKTPEYDRQLNRLVKLTSMLDKYAASFGLDPAARLKMHSATNVRLANAMHKVAMKKDEDEPAAVPVSKDPSEAVGRTKLDLFRPDVKAG